MPLFVNDGGTLREIKKVFVNDGGTLRELKKMFVNDAGTLREVFSGLAAQLSAWASTGGGVITGTHSSSSLSPSISSLTDGDAQYDNGDGTIQTPAWHVDGPSATNASEFEVRLTNNGGPATSGAAEDTWLNAGTARSWTWTGLTNTSFTVDLEYRVAGDASTVESRTITITITDLDAP